MKFLIAFLFFVGISFGQVASKVCNVSNSQTAGYVLTATDTGKGCDWETLGSASTVPFSGITGSTNTTAAMVVGAGASFTALAATRTAVFKSGTSPPATCTVGDEFFDTDAAAGQNFYGCTATNTWTQQGGATVTPGGSDTQIQFNNMGAFGGNENLTWLNSAKEFGVGGTMFYVIADPDSGDGYFLSAIGPTPSDSPSSGSGGLKVRIVGATGGNSTAVGTAVAGGGGTITIIGGNGGTAASAAVASTGGFGGGLSIFGGSGANATVTNSQNTGGLGGSLTIGAGDGGAAVGDGTAVNVGGDGGTITLTAGARGVASEGAMNTNGASGNILAVIQNQADSRFAVQANSADVFSIKRSGATLTIDSATQFMQGKVTASAAAPGVGFCSLEWRAGTNAGTGKLVAYCGTSSTGVTVIDNVGNSF